MAVGTTPFTCYQGEDVLWTFTLSDANLTDWTGRVIKLVIKETAADPDPALLGPFTLTILTATTGTIAGNIDVDPGSYVYSLRGYDANQSWEYATAAVTVLDSASVDV